MCRGEFADGVGGRVADVAALVAILGIERWLKGEDTKNLVAVLGDAMYAPFLPRPYLRRDIVDDAGIGQVLLAELGHTQVEGRIVDEYEHIGLLVQERLFGNAEITLDFVEIFQDRQEPHIRHISVIHPNVAALCTHLVAP